MRKCDACGKVYAENKDIFCPHCGAVGQKDCNHGASFDSSRWDRGEIYGNGNNTYKQGSEPHAQRTPSAYNTNGKKPDLSGGQYGSDYNSGNPFIRNLIQTVRKIANQTKNDEKKVVKIIGAVFAVIAIFNVFISAVSEFNSTNNIVDVFNEDVSEDYSDFGYEYPVYVVAGGVNIEPFEDWDGTWFFDMYLESLYISSDESELSVEVCDKLSGDEYIRIDGMFYTMPDRVMSFDKYDAIVFEEGSYIRSDAHSTDSHTIQYWFETGDIVYFDYLTIKFDDGSTVSLTLPFNAFRCDEEGNVVYYTCNVNEEENRVTFDEIAPVMYLEEFDCVVEF